MKRALILLSALALFVLFTAGECRKLLGVENTPTEPPAPAPVEAFSGGACFTDATVPLTIFFRDESTSDPPGHVSHVRLELFNPAGRSIDSRTIQSGDRIEFTVAAAGVYRIEQMAFPDDGGRPDSRSHSCEVPVPILGR